VGTEPAPAGGPPAGRAGAANGGRANGAAGRGPEGAAADALVDAGVGAALAAAGGAET
jgi:hypothetical protein